MRGSTKDLSSLVDLTRDVSVTKSITGLGVNRRSRDRDEPINFTFGSSLRYGSKFYKESSELRDTIIFLSDHI